MRKLIIAGTYAQYRDWLVLHKANPRAALYIHRPEQLLMFDPLEVEIELAGDYRKNPAYMSDEHMQLIFRQENAGIDRSWASV